jgi:hypothetical protein
MNDLSPESLEVLRKNITFLSFSIIVYFVAGGHVDGEVLKLPMINISFYNFQYFKLIIIILMIWWAFRYFQYGAWSTLQSSSKNELQSILRSSGEVSAKERSTSGAMARKKIVKKSIEYLKNNNHDKINGDLTKWFSKDNMKYIEFIDVYSIGIKDLRKGVFEITARHVHPDLDDKPFKAKVYLDGTVFYLHWVLRLAHPSYINFFLPVILWELAMIMLFFY